MLALIPTNDGGAPLTMSSREIAELTGSTHDNVLKTIRRLVEVGVISGNDTPYVHPQNGQTYTEFLLSYRDTMVVVSGYSVELRARIIDRWQELESGNVKPAPVAINVRDHGQLVTIAMQLIEVNQEQQATIDQQQRKIEADAPMVEGFERIAKSDGSMCVTDAAKTLQVPPRQLFQLLQARGWSYRRPMGSGWLAYQDRIQQGYLEHKVTTGERTSDGHEWSNTQMRVTPKGLARLAVILGKEGGGPLHAAGDYS